MGESYGVYWQDNSTLLCFIGGLLIGLIAALRMSTRGKVTGISGFLQTSIKITAENINEKIVSFLFVVGLVLGGVIGEAYLPAAYEDWSGLSWERLILAGALVGYGTVTGNGCTSGHGVCGIASLRVRSFVATAVFFIAAIVTAMATNTSGYLPFFQNELNPFRAGAILGVFIAVSFVAAGIAKFASLRQLDDRSLMIVRGFTDCLFGMSFAIALLVSNMTRLSATISFLDLRYWNPALAFVMMPAIPIAFVGFYFAKKLDSPFLDAKFSTVAITAVDPRLVFGALIFGIGWGLAGACPGPAIANLGSGNTPPIVYCVSIVIGMWIQHSTDKYLPATLKTNSSAAVRQKEVYPTDKDDSENKNEQFSPVTAELAAVQP